MVIFIVTTGMQSRVFEAPGLTTAIKMAVEAQLPRESIAAGQVYVKSTFTPASIAKALDTILTAS